MPFPRKFLLWIVPPAALVALTLLSLYHQAVSPQTPGRTILQALQEDGLDLRNAQPLFQFVPDGETPIQRLALETLVLEACGDIMYLPPDTRRVEIDLPPATDTAGSDALLRLRADLPTGTIDRELRRNAEMPALGPGTQLSVLGNAFLLPPGTRRATLTAIAGGTPLPLAIEIRGDPHTNPFIFTRQPSPAGTLRDSLRAPGAAETALLAGLQRTGMQTAAAAREALDAARERLAQLTDEQLLREALAADGAVLEQTTDRPRAAELAILLTTFDPHGPAAFFPRDGRTVYALTVREDLPANPPRCRVYCFDPAGRELWHGAITHPAGGTPMLTLLHHLTAQAAPQPTTSTQ